MSNQIGLKTILDYYVRRGGCRLNDNDKSEEKEIKKENCQLYTSWYVQTELGGIYTIEQCTRARLQIKCLVLFDRYTVERRERERESRAYTHIKRVAAFCECAFKRVYEWFAGVSENKKSYLSGFSVLGVK